MGISAHKTSRHPVEIPQNLHCHVRSVECRYHGKYDWAKIDASLNERVTFANHNLVTEGVFGEMNSILCRNVFIYFNQALQGKVLNLFLESLCHDGFLCLGKSESLRFSNASAAF
jgi:chemotaxis protein methyltransferase CheR